MGSYEEGYPELKTLAEELRALTHRIDRGLTENGQLPLAGLSTGAGFLEWSHAMELLLIGLALPGKQEAVEYLTAEEQWGRAFIAGLAPCAICGSPADKDGNHSCSCIPF